MHSKIRNYFDSRCHLNQNQKCCKSNRQCLECYLDLMYFPWKSRFIGLFICLAQILCSLTFLQKTTKMFYVLNQRKSFYISKKKLFYFKNSYYWRQNTIKIVSKSQLKLTLLKKKLKLLRLCVLKCLFHKEKFHTKKILRCYLRNY